MEFTLRDVIYFAVYVATVVALFVKFKAKQADLEKSYNSLKNIIFLERGGLNIVDNETCRKHQDSVYRIIRRESEITSDAIDQIHCMNQNVIKIMMHMNLEPIAIKPQSRDKGFHVEPHK